MTMRQDPFTAGLGEQTGPTHWPSLLPDEARPAWAALRDHERICFAPNASPSGAIDWFRSLREIENRMIQACARTQCSINEHRPDPDRTWTTDQAAVSYTHLTLPTN